jgi:hypothetical protein
MLKQKSVTHVEPNQVTRQLILQQCMPGDLVAVGGSKALLAVVVAVLEDSDDSFQLLNVLCFDERYVTSYNDDFSLVLRIK